MNVYEIITERFVEMLEAGTAPWHKPWRAADGGALLWPASMATGKRYQGSNVFLLAVAAMDAGYSSPYWGTYAQIAKQAGMVKQGKRWISPDGTPRGVRRGETGQQITYWNIVPRKPRENEDPTKKYTKAILVYHYVFNADQADALPEKYYPVRGTEEAREFEPIESAECAFKGYFSRDGAPSLSYGGDRAYYNGAVDAVRLPERESFDDSEAFYATGFHEAVHSTGHESRLNRSGIVDPTHFGSVPYGKEELVAEMGSAFLRAMCGIEAHFDNSAAYLASWVKAIKGDPRMVVHAAAAAQKAAELVMDEPGDD